MFEEQVLEDMDSEVCSARTPWTASKAPSSLNIQLGLANEVQDWFEPFNDVSVPPLSCAENRNH